MESLEWALFVKNGQLINKLWLEKHYILFIHGHYDLVIYKDWLVAVLCLFSL